MRWQVGATGGKLASNLHSLGYGKLPVNSSIALINPLNAELHPICLLLALLGAHPILHISRIRVKLQNTLYRFFATTNEVRGNVL
jgi:hypothetical protein